MLHIHKCVHLHAGLVDRMADFVCVAPPGAHQLHAVEAQLLLQPKLFQHAAARADHAPLHGLKNSALAGEIGLTRGRLWRSDAVA